MLQYLKKSYLYLVSLPDRWYPFGSEIEGKWVRGQQSYAQAVERAFAKYGPGRLGYKLTIYRETCHFVGSIIFIFCATVLSKDLFGSETALYVLLGAAILALSFQEFYVHPKHWHQKARKGLFDWFSWTVPVAIYFVRFGSAFAFLDIFRS